MNPKHTPPPSPSIALGDIYDMLFRHKWLVAILSLVFLISAILVLIFWHLPYESEAKLLIKYVKEAKPPEQSTLDSQVTSPDSRGDNIINSEIEILISMDLISNVVDILTPARILAKAGGGTNKMQAAFLIKKGLKPEEPKRSDVITIIFSHPDPEMVQPILRQIIDSYLKKHSEIHRPDYNPFLTQESDIIKHKMDDTETALREAKHKANNILDLAESKKDLGDRMAKTELQIYEAEADYASYVATIKEMQKLLPKSAVLAGASAPTNNVDLSNNVASPNSNNVASAPPDKVSDYQKICEQLTTLQLKGQELRHIYTTNSSLVQVNQTQITSAETEKKQLEDKYPGLIAMRPVETKGTGPASGSALDPLVALNEEMIKAKALEAKITVLTNEMAEIQSNAAAVTAQEGPILQLQRDKELEDTEFTYYSRRLEESRADEVFGPGNANINEVESPTPPARDSMKITKIAAGVFFGGLVLALGLPFLIELYLDRSLKRPLDVQASLRLPFFISIPEMNGNGKARALKGRKKVALLAAKTGETSETGDPQTEPPTNGHLALWQGSHDLQPYFDNLRDRLVTFFEMINLTHKPKLVAVTSCGDGAGVTTTAASLASSLSETGEGNVLLVNMNVRDGEAHHFYKGRLTCGLDEVLEKETRDGALVQGKLYVAKELENDEKLPRILPKRFNHLLPKMKASDFDYIIFDMPPVSQISITPRLARFMDLVLLVVESGETDRDAAKRAADLLVESKTNVGVVLNKSRSYRPGRRHHDI